MRPQWLWDKNISEEEIKIILKDPEHERFMNLAALLMSRNNTPKEIFEQYLDKKLFVQNWSRIKRQMRKDSWNDPRIIFWQAVYEKLRDEFKEKGMVIRARPAEITGGSVSQQIAEKIKTARRELSLTQGELKKDRHFSADHFPDRERPQRFEAFYSREGPALFGRAG